MSKTKYFNMNRLIFFPVNFEDPCLPAAPGRARTTPAANIVDHYRLAAYTSCRIYVAIYFGYWTPLRTKRDHLTPVNLEIVRYTS